MANIVVEVIEIDNEDNYYINLTNSSKWLTEQNKFLFTLYIIVIFANQTEFWPLVINQNCAVVYAANADYYTVCYQWLQ